MEPRPFFSTDEKTFQTRTDLITENALLRKEVFQLRVTLGNVQDQLAECRRRLVEGDDPLFGPAEEHKPSWQTAPCLPKEEA